MSTPPGQIGSNHASSPEVEDERQHHTSPSMTSPSTVPNSKHRRHRSSRKLSTRSSAIYGPSSLPEVTDDQLVLCASDVAVSRRRKGNVLENVSALITSGRLTAVVNCCGTHSAFYLLNALAGQEEPDQGYVLLNGTPTVAPSYRSQAAFLDADFAAFEELTVRENLEFASSMRVETSSQPYSVDTILDQLLLTSVQHHIVRRCNLYVRRRVSLGKELLRNPAVVVIDQPLEGLATHEAQQYLGILRSIAAPAASDAETTAHHLASPTDATAVSMASPRSTRNDCIVVFSAVQPRWSQLKYVDDVVLLVGGSCFYAGPLEDVFSAELPEPPTTSTSSQRVQQSSAEDPLAFKEAFIHNLYRIAVAPIVPNSNSSNANNNNSSSSGAQASLSPDLLSGLAEAFRLLQQRQLRSVKKHLQACAAGERTLAGRAFKSPGAVVHLFYLIKYSLLQIQHNALWNGALLLIAAVLTMALVALYSTQQGQTGMQNRLGVLFFLVSCVFLQCILSVGSIRKDLASFQRHRAHGYYSTLTFVTYTVITCAFRRFFIASTFALFVYLLSNFGLPWREYPPIFELAVIIAITSFCSYFVVLLTSAVMWSLRADTLVLYALYTVNIILGGLVLNLPTLPRGVQMLSFLTVIRLSYESSILTQFTGRAFGCASSDGSDETVLGRAGDVPYTCYTGTEYAKFLGFEESRRWTNVAALSGISGVLILCCFTVMALYRPQRSA